MVHQRRNLGIWVRFDKATAELMALVDSDQPGVVLGPRVACREQLFEHDGDLDAVRRRQRIQLHRVPTDRQIFFMSGPGDGPVDVGKLATVFFVPSPDFGRGIGCCIAHRIFRIEILGYVAIRFV